jgi:hypothetical protein
MQTITLNKNTFFWGVGNILLNFENRGPVTIDFDKLPLADKTTIKNSFFANKIEVSEELATAINNFTKPAISSIPDKVLVQGKTIESFVKEQDEKKRATAIILNGTLGNIMKNIGACDDVRKVQLMIKLEEENKKRTKVLDALNKRLSFLTVNYPKTENFKIELDEDMTDEEGTTIQIVK